MPPTIAKTYVFKISRDFEMLYLRYFSTNHSQTSQHLLNLRALFPASRRIYFPWRVHEQSLKEKKVGNVCYTSSYCCEALVFFFSIWTQTWVPVSSHIHLDRFDLHENRALKFKNLYNFFVFSSEFPSHAGTISTWLRINRVIFYILTIHRISYQ